MTELWALIKRDTKLYFRDKGMFFSSLITPVILLVLYGTFLKNVYEDSFRSALAAAGATASDAVIGGCVGGQLISSLLAVCCVTVAFCANLITIRDKTSGVRSDISMTPAKPGAVALGYYLSTLFSALIVSLTASAFCFGYLAMVGWYLSVGDVFLLLLDVLLLTMFGTALASCVNFFLTTDGQASAVGTIVSAGYGFLCGAYMPLASFSDGLQHVMGFLPGTYGTSLLRAHALRGVFSAMRDDGFPAEVVEKIGDSIDCNLYFYGTQVGDGIKALILAGTIVLLIGLYVFFCRLAAKRTGR